MNGQIIKTYECLTPYSVSVSGTTSASTTTSATPTCVSRSLLFPSVSGLKRCFKRIVLVLLTLASFHHIFFQAHTHTHSLILFGVGLAFGGNALASLRRRLPWTANRTWLFLACSCLSLAWERRYRFGFVNKNVYHPECQRTKRPQQNLQAQSTAGSW